MNDNDDESPVKISPIVLNNTIDAILKGLEADGLNSDPLTCVVALSAVLGSLAAQSTTPQSVLLMAARVSAETMKDTCVLSHLKVKGGVN